MKYFLTTVYYFILIYSFGQNLDSCGVDNNSKLTIFESKYLNEYLKNQRDTFDLTGKQIIFVTGSSARTIGEKKEYFTDIKEWNLRNSKIATDLVVLTREEKIESGGYDAILTYWVKFLPDKKKIFEKIKTCH
jgi:hypothetical protein